MLGGELTLTHFTRLKAEPGPPNVLDAVKDQL